MNRQKVLRISVPVIILLIILGIWSVKNYVGSNTDSVLPSESGAPSLTEEEKADFVLDAEALDMDKLTSYGLPIVIDFGADWCGPCKQFAPVFDAMHDEMLSKAIFKYVDVDKHSEIASDYPVSVIPTQVFINPDGTPYVPSKDLGIEFKTYSDKESGKTAFTVHEGGLTETELRDILADMGVSE